MFSPRVGPPWLLCATFLLACGAGCAKPTAEVTGTITIAGKAPNLPNLVIAFLADDGEEVTAPINLDGTYAAMNVPVGELRVGFMGGLPKGTPKGRRPTAGADGQIAPPIDLAKHPIPEPLRAATTSDLKFTAEPGKANAFNYDIQP
jgi:hypothetical protein